MNCKKFTQLIPLFIEADLEVADMQSVTAHLVTCDSCSNSVKEFQTSQSMLRNFAAPEFDEDVFAQMRSTVLNEIACPKFSDAIHPLWNWKAAFVASSATIILICVIAINRHGQPEIHIAEASNIGEVKATNFKSASSENLANSSPAVKQIPNPRSGRNLIAQGEASKSERNPGYEAAKLRSPERATEIEAPIVAASIAPSGANDLSANIPKGGTLGFILPSASQAENTIAANSEKPAAEPEMLRMEIQTADPNIKIIWLMPQTNTQADRK